MNEKTIGESKDILGWVKVDGSKIEFSEYNDESENKNLVKNGLVDDKKWHHYGFVGNAKRKISFYVDGIRMRKLPNKLMWLVWRIEKWWLYRNGAWVKRS